MTRQVGSRSSHSFVVSNAFVLSVLTWSSIRSVASFVPAKPLSVIIATSHPQQRQPCSFAVRLKSTTNANEDDSQRGGLLNVGRIPNAKNPSQAFGSPLTDETKKFNQSTVGFIKNLVFNTAFAGEGRDYARFYTLETIARMPYFSYVSVLHLYETLGWWRKANYLKIHFAESWNEMHHLLIMEELGGAERFADRFIAQHIACAYYWIAVAMYMVNPTMAYNLNQYVEEHAYATYDRFLKDNAEELRKLPSPQAAREYYRDGDLYMFDEFHTETCEARRPPMNTLYDAFVAIRDDEYEHVKTMASLQTDVELTNVNVGKREAPKDLFETA